MSVKRYDFDCYAFYDSARLTVQECDDGDYILHSDYAALLARHNALREAVAWERECCQDIRPLIGGRGLICMYGEGYVDKIAEDLRARQDAARAEVDRLLGEK